MRVLETHELQSPIWSSNKEPLLELVGSTLAPMSCVSNLCQTRPVCLCVGSEGSSKRIILLGKKKKKPRSHLMMKKGLN